MTSFVSAFDGPTQRFTTSRSSTITRGDVQHGQATAPLHPGEVLREEFMEPLNLSAGKLAKACLVPRTRIERIAREEVRLSGDTAVRLAKLFGASAEFWLNLQVQFDAETAKRAAAKDLAAIKPLARESA
jgi:addiction module HigA family antidote